MSMIDTVVAAQEANIGTEIGLSDWLTIDQPMIDDFARVTMDDQFIHVDPERAKAETPFGGTIAHGFLTLSLGSKFVIEVFDKLPGQIMGINYGFDKVRFVSPVRCNSRIRARFVLNAVDKRSDTELKREIGITVEIENSKTPALVANWLSLAVFAP